MKRDTPAAVVPSRRHYVTATHVQMALRVLARQERTAVQLQAALVARLPDDVIHIDRILQRLAVDGHLQQDGEMIGLSDLGMLAEQSLPRERDRPEHLPDPEPMSEMQRRLAVSVTGINPAHLTCSPPRALSSAADNRLPPMRTGCEAALALPSRIGDCLHYRDGRITTMAGVELQAGGLQARQAYTPTRTGNERTYQVYPH